jgi:hypothetical protein
MPRRPPPAGTRSRPPLNIRWIHFPRLHGCAGGKATARLGGRQSLVLTVVGDAECWPDCLTRVRVLLSPGLQPMPGLCPHPGREEGIARVPHTLGGWLGPPGRRGTGGRACCGPASRRAGMEHAYAGRPSRPQRRGSSPQQPPTESGDAYPPGNPQDELVAVIRAMSSDKWRRSLSPQQTPKDGGEIHRRSQLKKATARFTPAAAESATRRSVSRSARRRRPTRSQTIATNHYTNRSTCPWSNGISP